MASEPSREALALAREQLGDDPLWDQVYEERATVIELRRQKDKLLEEWHTALAELATERQRSEDALAQIRVQQTMLDSYQVDLATERRVLECAKAMLADMEEDRNTERQRAEAAERVRDAMAENWDKLCAHRDQWQQRAEVAEAAVEGWRDSFKHHMEASEAKRKALREALVKYGSHRSGCSVSMRGTEDEGCTCGFYRLTCDDDLSADGKDTPPEETSMRGVRDDSEHYT